LCCVGSGSNLAVALHTVQKGNLAKKDNVYQLHSNNIHQQYNKVGYLPELYEEARSEMYYSVYYQVNKYMKIAEQNSYS